MDDSRDKLSSPPKMKVVITIVKICMMIMSWLIELNIETIASIIHGNKTM